MLSHLHAIIVHFPIFGIFFASIPLAWGFWKKDRSIECVGTILLAISLVSLPLLMKSGQSAMEDFYMGVLNPGLDDGGMRFLSLHFQAAQTVIKLGYGVLLIVIVELAMWRKSYPLKRQLALLILLLNILLLVGLSYVGYLGGQIRHPEFRTVSSEIGVPPTK